MEKALILLLAVSTLYVAATSNSDPNLIFNCDARSPLWGCDANQWVNGNRLNCRNKTQIMPWATKPIRSDCYEVFAGTEAAAVTSYTPDNYMYINVRVKCFKMMFRGILLYAVNKNETKVGEWYLPDDEPAWFSQPWEKTPGHTCEKAVMHATAQWKPYYNTFHFKAPAAGTGDVTFRCLIKYGDANTGDFFWPNARGDLKLTEGAKPTNAIQFKQTSVGQSCTEFCRQTDEGCDEATLKTLNSEEAMYKNIEGTHPCKLPYMPANDSLAVSYTPADEFCYYADTGAAGICDAKSADSSHFCVCAGKAAPYTASTPGVDAESPASKALLSIFLLPLLFINSPRAAFFAALVMMASSASAHNWVNSASRSIHSASTYSPCKPPVTDLPHAQVGKDQAFQIEWMTAHGSYAYFAIQHSKDAAMMKFNTESVLSDYIKNAPNGSNLAQTGKYQKFHRKPTDTLGNDIDGVDNPDYFLKVIPSTDPLFIPRPTAFGGRVGNIRPTATNFGFQMQYKPAQIAKDARVSYYNPKYPWLEAVYRFEQTALQAVRPDTANFYIPGRAGAGRYIVNYYWRGYRDCIDVDYKGTTQVAQIYGYPSNATRWSRIDHCLMEDPRNVFEATEVVTDIKYCIDACTRRGTGCIGVNLVPMMAPATAARGLTKHASDTWYYPAKYGTDMYVPWMAGVFNTTRALFQAVAAPTKYMCMTVNPAMPTDTMDDKTLSADSRDPIFYSTCYYKLIGNMFDDYLNKFSDSVVSDWRFGDKCVDCEVAAKNEWLDTAPIWKIADKCVNCDRKQVTAPKPTAFKPITVEDNTRCDGTMGSWSRAAHHTCRNTTYDCSKLLRPLGRTTTQTVNVDECAAMAAADTECSSTYMITKASPQKCYCYKKEACCKTCSRRPDTAYVTYEQSTTADATCATGIKSADNTVCCSASCGAGNCGTSTAAVDAVGFCSATTITRSCKTNGPPCKI
jgi:hypothetical protein